MTVDLTTLASSATAALVASPSPPVAEADADAVVAAARLFLRFLVDEARDLRAAADCSLASRVAFEEAVRVERRLSRLNFDHDDEAEWSVDSSAVVASSVWDAIVVIVAAAVVAVVYYCKSSQNL